MAVPNISSLPADVLRRVRFGVGRAGARRAAFSSPQAMQAQSGGASGNVEFGPGFAGALLARKKFDLLSEQALANEALQLGNIGRQYVAAGRNLEGNLEGRGILKSGEAMRDRIALGGEEKAARAAISQQTQDLINQYGMEFAYQLAQAQAAGGSGTAPVDEQPSPSPSPRPSPRPSPSPSPSPAPRPSPAPGAVTPVPSGGGSTPTVPGPFRPGVPAGVRDPQPIPNRPQPFRPGVPAGVRDPRPIPNPRPTRPGGGAPGLNYR